SRQHGDDALVRGQLRRGGRLPRRRPGAGRSPDAAPGEGPALRRLVPLRAAGRSGERYPRLALHHRLGLEHPGRLRPRHQPPAHHLARAMSENQLTTEGLITLYQLDTIRLGGQMFYFTSAQDFDHEITWGGQPYVPLPMDAQGFEMNTKGALP